MIKAEVKKKGRKPINSRAFERIDAVSAGSIIILRSQWKLVTPPGAHILRKYLKKEFKVETLESGKGWVITKLPKWQKR